MGSSPPHDDVLVACAGAISAIEGCACRVCTPFLMLPACAFCRLLWRQSPGVVVFRLQSQSISRASLASGEQKTSLAFGINEIHFAVCLLEYACSTLYFGQGIHFWVLLCRRGNVKQRVVPDW